MHHRLCKNEQRPKFRLVATCKLKDVNPVTYVVETLEAIIGDYPQNKKSKASVPWRFRKTFNPTLMGRR